MQCIGIEPQVNLFYNDFHLYPAAQDERTLSLAGKASQFTLPDLVSKEVIRKQSRETNI
jgi:hypothetical protein